MHTFSYEINIPSNFYLQHKVVLGYPILVFHHYAMIPNKCPSVEKEAVSCLKTTLGHILKTNIPR